jgi:hypothetical protein
MKMKKILYTILIVAMILSSAITAYGVDFTDTAGTKYEDAVDMLVEMNILNGYSDNTYRPGNTVSRAEMAAIVIRTLGRSSYENMQTPSFSDTKGHWAEDYIAIAYSENIIKGMTPSLFAPYGSVTYAQASAMLLRALGYTDQVAGGVWPSNYLNKAAELGMFAQIAIEGKANQPATRGDIALMAAAVAKDIRLYWEVSEEEPADNGKLADFTGKAIGIPLSVSARLNDQGDAVDEVEFLMGEDIFYLNTEDLGDVTVQDFMVDSKYTGSLYAVRMRSGVVRSIEVASAVNVTRYAELTENGGTGAFRLITENENGRLTVDGAALPSFSYASEASCYEAVFEGNELETFRSVSASSIEEGDYVRAWDLDEDYAGVAIVLVLIDKEDIAAAAAYGII